MQQMQIKLDGSMARHETIKTQKHQVRMGASTIYYETVGAGPPLMLVHGLAASSRWWVKNVQALGQHFQLYMLDLIGFGRSRTGQRFSLDEAARCLIQWMDQLKLEKMSIVGHSMGGRIAAELAADFPNRVDRLVLIDSPILPFQHGYTKQIWGMARALRHFSRDFLPVLIGDTLQAGSLNVLRIGRQLLLTDRSHKLAAIQAPTLIIWGDQDTIVPLALGKALTQGLPHSQFVTLKGAGHVPMWEKAEEFNRIVLDFLCNPTISA